MDMSKCAQMDANILLGIVNDKLRHECRSLHSLASMMDIDENKLANRLSDIGYHYDENRNQFSLDL